jgi:hypothetical protein
MVDREITDGRRIARLLQAELDGLERPPFDAIAVTNETAHADTEPPDNRIFDVEFAGETLATVYLQPDRISLEFNDGLPAAKEQAAAADLRTRPKATTAPGLLVFVEKGASVKRAVDVVAAAATGAE